MNKRINKPEILFSHQALTLPVRMKRIQLKIMLHLGRRAYDISLYEQFRYGKTERWLGLTASIPHMRGFLLLLSPAVSRLTELFIQGIPGTLQCHVHSSYPPHGRTLVRSDSRANRSCRDSVEPIRKAWVGLHTLL